MQILKSLILLVSPCTDMQMSSFRQWFLVRLDFHDSKWKHVGKPYSPPFSSILIGTTHNHQLNFDKLCPNSLNSDGLSRHWFSVKHYVHTFSNRNNESGKLSQRMRLVNNRSKQVKYWSRALKYWLLSRHTVCSLQAYQFAKPSKLTEKHDTTEMFQVGNHSRLFRSQNWS